MSVLPKLQPPQPPLKTLEDKLALDEMYNYIQALVFYLYNCNAPIVEQNSVLSQVGVGGVRTDLWPDAVTTAFYSFVTVGPEYTGGNITFRINRRTSTVGNAVMFYHAFRFREGVTFLNLAFAVYIPFNPASVNATYTTTVVLTNPSVQPGDIIRFDVERQGAHGSDTLAGDVYNDSITVSFI